MAHSPDSQRALIAELVPDLDRLALDSMADWKVPGAALAVVLDGGMALAKGYGQRDVEKNLPVTAATQFVICSITKSFTATGMALLHNEGRVDWTKPVRDYLPEFRLHDPVATERVTVRDLSCHQSGCHAMTGYISPAIALPLNCWASCAIWNSAAIFAPPISTTTSATTSLVS
jgi:CubicO group peptidase (beta-lactamase class C family)